MLFVEDNTVRPMGTKKFRKMIYNNYFDQSYLAEDRRKQELEADISKAFKNNDLAAAEKLCDQMEELVYKTREQA